jgi:AAA15 family ATPase/GTPase
LENIKLLKLRKNASFISIAAQYELIELNELYDFFRHFISNVGPAGLRASPISMNDAAEIYSKQPELFEHVKKFISDCDTGISNIKISTRIDASDEKVYFPVFFHNVQNNEFPVKDIHESSGTKTLFKNMALYRFALEVGGVLILDEFDINLHPHILPKLIDFFLDKTKNPFGAQFIFTTHNSEVLDDMGRYRSYFVNKVENESFGYRLDEIPGDIVRNDRSILPTYNAGKIGGVPAL